MKLEDLKLEHFSKHSLTRGERFELIKKSLLGKSVSDSFLWTMIDGTALHSDMVRVIREATGAGSSKVQEAFRNRAGLVEYVPEYLSEMGLAVSMFEKGGGREIPVHSPARYPEWGKHLGTTARALTGILPFLSA